ncbi:hypothetical protein GCM10010388_05410 [Streptomyces mauvecolor]
MLLYAPDPQVRKVAAPRAWVHLAPSGRAALLADPDAEVRTEALLRYYCSTPLSAAGFAELADDGKRERAARTCVLGTWRTTKRPCAAAPPPRT